jgi:hypothetical protein
MGSDGGQPERRMAAGLVPRGRRQRDDIRAVAGDIGIHVQAESA